ncbi:MAG: universal stress protein [Actinomycetota bacterium]
MTVVVGFVRSAEGDAALERAVAEAQLRSAPLIVVHSMEGGSKTSSAEVIAYREALREVEGRLQAEGVDHQVVELVRGNTPAEDLLEVADEHGAELIVIGVRRRSPVGKLILGSNAQDVLLGADCAVLAVKAGADAAG